MTTALAMIALALTGGAAELPGVAILGAAHPHVQDILEVLRAQQKLRVSAVWDAQPERAERVAAACNSRSAPSPEAAIEQPGTRAVIVAAETVQHEALVMAALARRKDVFVEKPLGIDAATAARLAAAIERAGVVFHTGFFLRELPAVRDLRAALRAGRIGRLVRLRCVFVHAGRLDGWFEQAPWMLDPAQAGHGGFADLGLHAADLLRWIAGDAAAVAAAIEPRASAEIDDYGEALVRLPDGAVGSIAAGWMERGERFVLEARGTRGSLRVTEGHLESTPGPGRAPRAGDAVQHFLQAITTPTTEPLGSPPTGVKPRNAAY